ncbi:MAG: capsular biosynthesis protein [Caulobacter sp.]|nr:capsular biosynthesis protein [Caulobacter sp.]
MTIVTHGPSVFTPGVHRREAPPQAPRAASEVINLRALVRMFLRRLRTFVAIAAAVLLIAVIVTLTAPHLYTAKSQVMFNPKPEQVVASPSVVPDPPAETAVIDTQVQVLQSRELARRVVDRLQLQKDPEFNRLLAPPSWRSGLKARLGLVAADPRPTSPAAREAQGRAIAAAALQRGLNVRRSGLTYLVDIAFTARDPDKAALIANTFAQEYLASQSQAKMTSTAKANQWLRQRLAALEPELNAKEAAVAAYRARNNLLSASGATLIEQEISGYNQQLAAARADEATEQARLSTARSQLRRGSKGDDVGEALDSQVIQKLREQRASVSARVADLQGRYGPRHPDMLNAKRELADIDNQIQEEIHRVMSNLEAKAQVARQRTASIAGSLDVARGGLAGTNASSVALNRLERDAQVARADYESLLARYRETASQAGLQDSDASLASQARAPGQPSSPNVPINLSLGLAVALILGSGAVLLLEMMDDRLATAAEVERKLNLPALGSIPLLASVAEHRDRAMTPSEHVLVRPHSAFAESFRGLRAALIHSEFGRPVRVLAVTSSLPGEGKTTVSLCLARSAAQAGLKVVLVDCDFRRRSLAQMLNIQPSVGLLDVLTGTCRLDHALLEDVSGAMLLPAVQREVLQQDVFSRPAVDRLLAALSGRFDLVILDTAPVLAVADTRVLAAKADAVVYVARWRRTSANAVEEGLLHLERSGAVIAGLALTQVDLRQQQRIGYGDPTYYYGKYKGYYANG